VSRIDLAVPDLGGFKDVPVIDVLVAAGDHIEIDTALITLETEKASMDVPATAAGKVLEVLIHRGDKVSSGSLIVRIEADNPAPAAETSAAVPPADDGRFCRGRAG
jgi:pyruvate/2-oxoglutarate dehydrogenase complex dihydrolipoamide acyltransferase (E2) component